MDTNSQQQPQKTRVNSSNGINSYSVPMSQVDSNGLTQQQQQSYMQHHLTNPLQFKQHSNNSRNTSNLDFITNGNSTDLFFQQRQSSNLLVPNYRPANSQPLQQSNSNGSNHTTTGNNNNGNNNNNNNGLPQRFANKHYANIIGDDNDISMNLKPLYKNYNIDITQWPLTNPPIFESMLSTYEEVDSSLINNNNGNSYAGLQGEGQDAFLHPSHMISEKDRRRRRVSISNGQIDQLNNDLLQMDQLYCSQPPIYPKLIGSNNNPNNNNNMNNNSMQFKGMVRQITDENTVKLMDDDGHIGNDHFTNITTLKTEVNEEDSFVNEKSKNSPRNSSSGKKGGAKRILPPSNTLIPGTPEYKKARLLERNRIAAMKCRQRKKLEKDLMERDYSQVIAENKQLKQKIHELEALLLAKNIQKS